MEKPIKLGADMRTPALPLELSQCTACGRECCNCVGCVARKGGRRDICSPCFRKETEARS